MSELAHICHECVGYRAPFVCPVDRVPIHIHAGSGECPRLLFPSRGLGDDVAKAIHAVTLGLVKPCGGCGERQRKLNEALPYRKD